MFLVRPRFSIFGQKMELYLYPVPLTNNLNLLSCYEDLYTDTLIQRIRKVLVLPYKYSQPKFNLNPTRNIKLMQF